MNTDQIAAEALRQFTYRYSISVQGEAMLFDIIKAAIEKAINAYDAELDRIQNGKGKGIMHESRAAHASESHKLPPDWNKDLPVITHLTPPSNAIEPPTSYFANPEEGDLDPWKYGDTKRLNDLYYELLFQVENKYAGESRHETAKRLIRQAQQSQSQPDSAMRKDE